MKQTSLVSCVHCQDLRWVCENHPNEPWHDILGCDCGPGAPCPACNPMYHQVCRGCTKWECSCGEQFVTEKEAVAHQRITEKEAVAHQRIQLATAQYI